MWEVGRSRPPKAVAILVTGLVGYSGKLMTRVSQNWDQILANRLLHHVSGRFSFLRNYENFTKMTNQLIVSWPDHLSPRWVIYVLYGSYGYQNDQEVCLISFPVTMSYIDYVLTKLWRHNWIFHLVEFLKIIFWLFHALFQDSF